MRADRYPVAQRIGEIGMLNHNRVRDFRTNENKNVFSLSLTVDRMFFPKIKSLQKFIAAVPNG